MKHACLTILAALTLAPAAAHGQESAPASLDAFDWMEGRWRGEAHVLTRGGPVTIIQTERSGEMLGGRVRVVEGKGYNPDGSVGFNAFAVIAQAVGGGYEMRSWTLEAAGGFPLVADPDGFHWEIPGGPGAVIRYKATFDGTTWTEIGHRVVEGQPPMEIFRMTLTRVDDTGWPAEGTLGKD